MKIDDLIERIKPLDVFEEKDGFEPVVGERFKRELLEMLIEMQFDMKSKVANDVSKVVIETKTDYIAHLENRIEYLEDFIVRLARETKDL